MIIALRFLGLFIVLPMLAVYAGQQAGATPVLIGMAVGGYALTQMLLQYPLGRLSDRIGRKKIIVGGLVLFALGSLLCAVSSDITMLILGRLLQGAGAISSTVTAMISDFTKESERSKAMAMMGGAIAMSFVVSMVAGPLLGGYFGIELLFIITTLLALAAIYIMAAKIPESEAASHRYEFESSLGTILKNPQLLRMNGTMFFHSSMMTMAFLIIPLTLTQRYGWHKSELWQVYVPAIVLGFLFMGLAAVLGEKHNKTKPVFLVSALLFGIAFVLFGQSGGSALFVTGVLVFFIGFMMLEPLLQSTTTKIARIHERGAALGVFNTVQFFGVFVGGIAGGWMMQYMSLESVGYLLGGVSLFWLLWMAGMKTPLKASFAYVEGVGEALPYASVLHAEPGVMDFYLNTKESVLVVKFDPALVEEADLLAKIEALR